MRSSRWIFHAESIPGAFGKLLHGFDYADMDWRFFRGYSLPPKSVCLILSEKCNLRCRMCDIGNASQAPGGAGLVHAITAGNEAMSREDWHSVIDDLAKFTPKPLVLLTGTEPFVSTLADDVIGHIASRKLPLHITTNGLLLEAHASVVAELCRRPFGIDIAVSLDGPPAVHDAIRGVTGVYEKALRGMEAVAAARAGLGRRFPRMSITCTVSNLNCGQLEAFVEGLASRKAPVDAITFNHLWFKDGRIVSLHNARYGTRFPVDEENVRGVDVGSIDMGRVQEEIGRIRSRFGSRYRIHEFPNISGTEAGAYYGDSCRFVFYNRCTAAWRNVTVTPRGRVILSPLCFLGDVGDLKRESFRALWNGSRMRSCRGLLRSQKAFPACSRCCMLFGSRSRLYKLREWLAGP